MYKRALIAKSSPDPDTISETMRLHGSSDFLSLPDLIQSTATAGRTCRITIKGRGTGDLFFRKGEIVHARYGELRGETAVYALVMAGSVEFEVEELAEITARRTIHASVPALLMEAARLEDEGQLVRPTLRTPTPPRTTGCSEVTTSPARQGGIVGRVVIAALVIAAVAGTATLTVVRPDLVWGSTEPNLANASLAVGALGVVFEATELTGPEDAQPKLLESVAVAPPRHLALIPSVVVRAKIDATGHVAEALVYRSRSDLSDFEAVAVQAVRSYRFEPAKKAGRPVAAWLHIPVTFDQTGGGRRAVRVKGSDAIGNRLGIALADAYAKVQSSALVTIESNNSTSGFEGLFDGSADIAAATRPIYENEIRKAETANIGLREFTIGYDGVVVIVHPDNPIDVLTVKELAEVFSGQTSRWSELGGEGLPIAVIRRSDRSGTYAFFEEKVVRAMLGRSVSTTPQARLAGSEKDVIKRVASQPSAIGYVSMAALDESVKALKLGEDATSMIAASPETVRLGTYPIHRPLIFYTRKDLGRETIGFLRFVLSAQGQTLVEEYGFVSVGLDSQALPSMSDAGDEKSAAPVTRIFFPDGNNRLDKNARMALDEVAANLKPGESLMLIGYADVNENRKRMGALARVRTNRVRAYLLKQGIDSKYVRVESVAPGVAGPTQEARRGNRRVDVLVVDSDVKMPEFQ